MDNGIHKRNFIKNWGYCLVFVLTNITICGLYAQIPDSLLKKANDIFNKNPKEGFELAKVIYTKSSKNNSTLTVLKALDIIVRYYTKVRDLSNAQRFAAEGLSISKNAHIDSLSGLFWYLSGNIAYYKNDYSLAVSCYDKAIIYYKNTPPGKLLGNTYLALGMSEKKLSNFELANFFYFKSSGIFRKLNGLSDLSSSYNSIALCFVSLSDYPKAIEYNKRALAIRLRLKDSVLVAQSFNNIGVVFKQYHKIDSAIVYFSKSIEMYGKLADSTILELAFRNLGACWRQKGNFSLSARYIKKSLNIAAKYNMKMELAQGNLNLAKLYIAENKYKPALLAINVTEQAAKELKTPDLLMEAYADKYTLFLKKADFKNALYYENKRNEIKDSLFTIAKSKAINELEIKYQTSLKEKDIANLNLQNNLQKKKVAEQNLSIIALVIGALLLSTLLVIAYRSYRQKNKDKIKIETLMRELNHRVANNLTLLNSLFTIQLEGMSDNASKTTLRDNQARLAAMNMVHSKLYLNHNSAIEMQEYLTQLLYHIKDSFDRKNVRLTLDLEPITIDADKAVATGILVQELATNAFKYAFSEKNTGEISLSLKQDKKNIILTFRDNGKGFSAVHKENETSFGLKLVNLMARQLGAKMNVQNENGLLYRFEIGV